MLVLTGRAVLEEVEEALNAGAAAYLKMALSLHAVRTCAAMRLPRTVPGTNHSRVLPVSCAMIRTR